MSNNSITRGAMILLMVLAVSVWAFGCTNSEEKAIHAIGTPSWSQPKAQLQGIVKDLCTGEAVNGVKVSMAYDGGLHEYTTNSSGLYAFSNIPVNTSEHLSTAGGVATSSPDDTQNAGNQYTIVADFTEYLKRTENAGKAYKTTYIGHVTLTYETLLDDIASASGANANTMTFTITGSGAATPVDGLMGGLDLFVSELNGSFTIPSVVNAADGSAISSAKFGLYCAYSLTTGADDVYVQTINYAGSPVTVSGLEGGRAYYLRELETLFGFFNDNEGYTYTGASAYFGGSANAVTSDNPISGDHYSFTVHCNEDVVAPCVGLIYAPCVDSVNPMIMAYSPAYLSENTSDTDITITFSEAMDTTYPPIETNAEEFLAVAVIDYRVSVEGNDIYGDTYFQPVSISAAWSADAKTLTITPDAPLDEGSTVLVALRGMGQVGGAATIDFTDVAGNPLLLNAGDATTATVLAAAKAKLYSTVPLNETGHVNGGFVANYAWITGQTTDWLFYIACDSELLSVTNLQQVGYYTSGLATLPVADTDIRISWTAPANGCVSAYRVYLMTTDSTCEKAVLIDEITEPYGSPATLIKSSLQDFLDASGVMTWGLTNTSSTVKSFIVKIGVVNCNGDEGPLSAPLVCKDPTGLSINYAEIDDITTASWADWDIVTRLTGTIVSYSNCSTSPGNGSPNDVWMDCVPYAGYFTLPVTGQFQTPVSNTSLTYLDDGAYRSVTTSAGVTLPAVATPCTLTNDQDPTFTYQGIIQNTCGFYMVLKCSNLWLVDTGDALSIDGTLDMNSNPAVGTRLIFTDVLGPIIKSADVSERGVNEDDIEDNYDGFTCVVSEQLPATVDVYGWMQMNLADASGIAVTVGAVTAAGNVKDTVNGVKYPNYSYNTANGDFTLNLMVANGTWDPIMQGDNATLGALVTDMANNPMLDQDGAAFDGDHVLGINPIEPLNDVTDDISPKITAQAGWAVTGGNIPAAPGVTLNITVDFSEEIAALPDDGDIDGDDLGATIDIDDVDNIAWGATHAQITFDVTLVGNGTADLDADGTLSLDNIEDLMGNALNGDADEFDTAGAIF